MDRAFNAFNSGIRVLFIAVICFSLFVYSITPILAHAATGGVAPPGDSSPAKLYNPIKSATLGEFVQKVTAAALKIGVPIAALFIIWAGFKFVTSRGDEGQLKEAKEIFFWTIIGTAVLLAASTLAYVLTETVSQIGI